jgi:hypothetical protein
MNVPSLVDLPTCALLSETIVLTTCLVCLCCYAYEAMLLCTEEYRTPVIRAWLPLCLAAGATVCLSIPIFGDNLVFRAIVATANAIPAQIIWYFSAPWPCHICDNASDEMCEDCDKVTCPRHLTVYNNRILCGNCAERKK